jgi:hypothetical protein
MAGVSDRVVALMRGNLDIVARLAGEDVVLALGTVLQVLGADQGAHVAVLVQLSKFVSICSFVVAQVHKVVGRTSFVFFASVEMLGFDLQGVLDVCVNTFHLFEPCNLLLQSIFAHLCVPNLSLFCFLLSNLLICDCKVLIKALLLCNSYLARLLT